MVHPHRLLDIHGFARRRAAQHVVAVRVGQRRDVDGIDIRRAQDRIGIVVPARQHRGGARNRPRARRCGASPRRVRMVGFVEPGPLLTSVTSPQPIIPQRIVFIAASAVRQNGILREWSRALPIDAGAKALRGILHGLGQWHNHGPSIYLERVHRSPLAQRQCRTSPHASATCGCPSSARRYSSSQPELVIAQCKAGVVGAFPALNARPARALDEWLAEITEELAAHDPAHPGGGRPRRSPSTRSSTSRTSGSTHDLAHVREAQGADRDHLARRARRTSTPRCTPTAASCCTTSSTTRHATRRSTRAPTG